MNADGPRFYGLRMIKKTSRAFHLSLAIASGNNDDVLSIFSVCLGEFEFSKLFRFEHHQPVQQHASQSTFPFETLCDLGLDADPTALAPRRDNNFAIQGSK